MSIRVVCRDCIDGLNHLDAGSVSAIVTSPPYNIGVSYPNSIDRRPDYLNWMEMVFEACKRALNEQGHFFLQVGGIVTHPTIPWEVLSQAQSVGFILQNQIVWVKHISIPEKTVAYGQFKPVNSTRFLNNTHEFIFHLTKTGNVPIDKLAVGVPLKYELNIKRFGHKKNLRCRGNVWFIPYDTIQSREDRHNHPAVFPTALPEMCIRLAGLKPASLVVDPFVGTGATLIACKNLKMRGLGFDISREFCDVAVARLKSE